jgi:O-antigen/teichoic acid export membrane protein
MPPSIARRTAIGAGWLVAWRMLTRLLGVASTLLLARLLTPADFGLVAMASTFYAAIDALTQIGVQDALVRRTRDDTALYDAAFTLQVGRALLSGLVIAAAAPLAAWWFAEPRLIPVVLVLAAVAALAGLENTGIVEFRRELRFDRQFVLLAVPRLLQVAVTVPLALALHSYWALLAGIAVGRLSRVAATYAVHAYRPRFRLAGWRELAGFSLWSWASSAIAQVWERCDPVVLGPALGPSGLGLYLLATELAILPVSELIAPAADALFAGFSNAQKQGVDLVRAAPAVAVALLLGTAPLVIAISASAGAIVATLLGAKWAAAQPLIALLAWQCLFSPFSYVCSTVLVTRGRMRLNFFGTLTAAAIRLAAVVTVVAFTRRLDVVALAIVAVVGAEATGYMAFLHRAGEVSFRGQGGALLRVVLAGAVTVALLAATGLGWRPMPAPGVTALLQGAATGGVAIVCYAAAVALLWLAAGRPAGPERQVASLLARLQPTRAPRPA